MAELVTSLTFCYHLYKEVAQMRSIRWIGLCMVLGALGAAGFWWQSALRHTPMPAVETPAQAEPALQTPPPTLTLSFVGDIMLASGVGRVAAAQGSPHLFSGVRQVLLADDLTIGNLECAVATVGTPEEDKQYTFRADPAVLPGMKASGVDAVSLANNHALDYGREALVQTFTHLQQAGIPFAGAGVNADAAYRPVIIPVKGRRVALVAASRVLPATAWYATANRSGLAAAYDPTRLLQEVRTVRKGADLVVVYLHWGKERMTTPLAYQRTLGQRCIEAGADLVIGSHPHVLQGFEYYQGKLIAYSLGNFVFTDSAKATAILQTTFSGNTLQRATVLPCRIADYRPQLIATPAARRTAQQGLQQISYGITIGANGELTKNK